MFRGARLQQLKRFLCAVVGIGAIAFGLLHRGHEISYSYRNWFGGLVFGPIVAVLGIVALLGAIFNWRRVWDSPPTDAVRRRH